MQPNNDAQNARTVELKGKYLKVVQDFVDSLSLDDRFEWLSNEKHVPLAKAVVRLHGTFMTVDDAEDLVARECVHYMHEWPDARGALTAPENIGHNQELVRRLKLHIESLPRQYVVYVELPKFPVSSPMQIQISNRITLVTGSKLPLPKSARAKSIDYAHLHNGRASYLEIKTVGYAAPHPRSPAIADSFAQLKYLAFNLVAYGLFHRISRKSNFVVTFRTLATDEIHLLHTPHELNVCIGSIVSNQTRLLARSEATAGLLDLLAGMHGGASTVLADTDSEVEEALRLNLSPVKEFFESSSHPDFSSIGAAIEWYEDSQATENETFGYLAACIGLEAILGSDETMTSMSKRLADRYSFLLGKNRSEREAMAAEYGRVLDLRGKLVHAKAVRLQPQERYLLNRAREMLKRVIQHEVKVMK
jgi:hypothetical protein